MDPNDVAVIAGHLEEIEQALWAIRWAMSWAVMIAAIHSAVWLIPAWLLVWRVRR